MDPQRSLHIRRLREALDKVTELRQSQVTAHAQDFQRWKERAIHSLNEVFGNSHLYTIRFARLRFLLMRISIGRGPTWSREDQEVFERDLQQAEEILNDALEEVEIAPDVKVAAPPATTEKAVPSIVINVTNVLSQTTSVQIEQVLASLDELGLPPDVRKAAESHARELEQEVRGEQRWPVLAKSLEALKSLGKSVYERVALPLLLDMLKRQAGL